MSLRPTLARAAPLRPLRLIAGPALAVALAGTLSACDAPEGAARGGEAPFAPVYLGVETRLLDADLVNLRVVMQGARDRADVDAYARCAAAGYALIRGYGFARHLRTTIAVRDGLWQGDAVYTVSAALPPGLRTLDAEVVADDCAASGIPTV